MCYRKSGYSRKFYESHREAITLHKAAKDAFNELGIRKLPKVKDLSAEYAEVLADKKPPTRNTGMHVQKCRTI